MKKPFCDICGGPAEPIARKITLKKPPHSVFEINIWEVDERGNYEAERDLCGKCLLAQLELVKQKVERQMKQAARPTRRYADT